MMSADVENKTGALCGLSQKPGDEKRTCEGGRFTERLKRPLEDSETVP